MCEEMIADMLAEGEINVPSTAQSVSYPHPGQAAVTLPPITTFVSKKIKKMIETDRKTDFAEPTASPNTDEYEGYDSHPRNVIAHANSDDSYVNEYTYDEYSGDYYSTSSLTDDEDHLGYSK